MCCKLFLCNHIVYIIIQLPLRCFASCTVSPATVFHRAEVNIYICICYSFACSCCQCLLLQLYMYVCCTHTPPQCYSNKYTLYTVWSRCPMGTCTCKVYCSYLQYSVPALHSCKFQLNLIFDLDVYIHEINKKHAGVCTATISRMYRSIYLCHSHGPEVERYRHVDSRH
jgi:hypothetical protein